MGDVTPSLPGAPKSIHLRPGEVHAYGGGMGWEGPRGREGAWMRPLFVPPHSLADGTREVGRAHTQSQKQRDRSPFLRAGGCHANEGCRGMGSGTPPFPLHVPICAMGLRGQGLAQTRAGQRTIQGVLLNPEVVPPPPSLCAWGDPRMPGVQGGSASPPGLCHPSPLPQGQHAPVPSSRATPPPFPNTQ